MADHKVDIIIPCYNYGHFLDECVESVLSQSFKDFRVLLIDNDSKDDTQKRAKHWEQTDPRISYVRNKRNLGFHGSIKKAISLTEADLVVILPVDDLWEEDFLKETVSGLNHYPEAAMAYTKWGVFRTVNDRREAISPILIPHQGSGLVNDRDLLIGHNWIPLSFGVFRRKSFEEVGGIRKGISQLADYELWLNMAVRWPFYYCDRSLGNIRDHDQNWSKNLIASGKCADEYIDIDDRIFADQKRWPDHTRFLVKARQIRRFTGKSIAHIAQEMLDDGEQIYTKRLETCKADFIYAVGELVLKTLPPLNHRGKDGWDKGLYGTLEEGLELLKKVLDDEPKQNHRKIRELYETFKGHNDKTDYQQWVNKHSMQEIHGQVFAERMMMRWKAHPGIHLALILRKGEEALLADTIDSLSAQMYKNWFLTIISDFPSPDPMFAELDILEWVQIDAGADLYGILNQSIENRKADWTGLIEPGIQFEPNSLFSYVDYINIRPDWKLIYTDEDHIMDDGTRTDPKFKPDFNLDMLRSMPYIGGSCLIRREELEKVGGYAALPGSENHDLAFKILDHYGEGAIGHISDVLLHIPESSRRSPDEAVDRVALINHLQRNKIKAEVAPGYHPGTSRVIYQHSASPLVSIIIPTKNKLELFQPCIESLLEKTTYPNYEVIVVDNQTTDPDTLNFYQAIKKSHPSKVKILPYAHPFNFSAICNFAARKAKGEYLVLLNNDTQVIQGEWLNRLMLHGQRKEVGIVGARLIYPETNKIQHVGIILGLSDVADHPYYGELSINEPGYLGRAQIDQNLSAVTAACLLIRKSTYKMVGGMDEERLKILYNDVDLCLKVTKRHLKIVWTPYATLVHHGSQSLKESVDVLKLASDAARKEKEIAFMLKKWSPVIANDPAYNPQLSLNNLNFHVESNVVVNWDVNFHDRPRILGLPLPGGCGEYRVISPCRALGKAAISHSSIVSALKVGLMRVVTPTEVERAQPDTLLIQTAISDPQIKALELYKRYNAALRVFTLDDLVTKPPEKSPFYKKVYRDAKPRLRKALSHCDRLIVTTEPLADLCRDMIDDIRLIPNRLEKSRWCHLTSKRREGKKPRVGWVGAQQHHGDLELIETLVRETADEVDWIFMGMCLDTLKPYAKEVHDYVLSFDEYPEKVSSLNLDLAIAPLEMNPFNEAKSNLRLLEYGILGWPVVCTDILPYQRGPVKRVPNQPKAWIEAIRERINDLDATADEGDALKKWVLNHYILEDHLDIWKKALLH